VQVADVLGDAGAYGVNFHDNDLIPIDATPAEAEASRADFKRSLKNNGLVVPMATTNLFSDPVFKDGAVHQQQRANPRLRGSRRPCGRWTWGPSSGPRSTSSGAAARGTESDGTKDPVEAVKRFREAVNFLCEYSIEQGYGYKFAFEAKPNEPRGHMYFAVTGSYLALDPTLDHPGHVRREPRVRPRDDGRA
jgi:xylose isomerase